MSTTLRKRNVNFQTDKDEEESDGWEPTNGNSKKDVIERNIFKTPVVDQWLQKYVQFTSSAFKQDKVLKVVQYSLWIISRYWGKEPLSKLSLEISWTRYVNRFFGLPAALEAARSGSWGKPKSLGKAMAWSMLLYYPLEHIAYLKWQSPKLFQGKNSSSQKSRLAEKASAWSCRFWFVYIVLDIVRSSLALKKNDIGVSEKRMERLQVMRNALFSLPAIHWSLPKWDTHPWLPDELVNGLMWLESVVCMYQAVSS